MVHSDPLLSSRPAPVTQTLEHPDWVIWRQHERMAGCGAGKGNHDILEFGSVIWRLYDVRIIDILNECISVKLGFGIPQYF